MIIKGNISKKSQGIYRVSGQKYYEWHRIFEKMAASGPVPEELSIDSTAEAIAELTK